MTLYFFQTTSFHNPQIVQEYEDELAALHLQLKQKDERIRQLEQQAEAGVAQQQEQCKIVSIYICVNSKCSFYEGNFILENMAA